MSNTINSNPNIPSSGLANTAEPAGQPMLNVDAKATAQAQAQAKAEGQGLRATGISSLANVSEAPTTGIAQIDAIIQSGLSHTALTTSQQTYIESLPNSVFPGLERVTSGATGTISAETKTGAVTLPDSVQADFGGVVKDSAAGTMPVDVNALVQYVLRESYQETTKDLYFYAEKVKFFNETKKTIREELARARDALVPMAGKEDDVTLPDTFFGKTIDATYSGQKAPMSETNAINYETVDAAFTSGLFAGERAAGGSSYDPVAVRLGEGDATINTPDGSFVIEGEWKESPQFKTTGSQNWTPNGGLSGVAKQVWEEGLKAADANNDGQISASEEADLPLWWGGGFRPEGAAENGTPESQVVWKSEQQVLDFLVGEARAGRINVSDTARSEMNKNPPRYDVGLANVSIEYYEEVKTTQWFAPTMGILVRDANGDGQIQRGDLFGDDAMTQRGTADGYQDMALIDVNGDGKLSAEDGAIFNELQIWQDLDSDGKVGEGELKSLAAHGLLELSTNALTGATGEMGIMSTSSALATDIITKGDLSNYIQDMEEQLSSVGDDAQLANVDLQNILQKQQQTMQMMSNIAKMLHDTGMAVIRKIGG